MWEEYNPNPVARRVGDCAVRAVAKALDIDWETAYLMLVANGFAMGDVMNADSVWGATLRQHGFYREGIPNTCPDCYTVQDFISEHPDGTFVVGTGGHCACIKNSVLYDTWNSLGENVIFYWYGKE